MATDPIYSPYYLLLGPADAEAERRRRGTVGGALVCCIVLGCLIGIGTGLAVGFSGPDDDDGGDIDDDDGDTSPSPSLPFCCVQDPYVGSGSSYASTSPTCCGDYDYNCDGFADHWACCGDEGELAGVQVPGCNGGPSRTLYNRTSDCRAEPLPTSGQQCGACTGPDTLVPGWQCTVPDTRKRFVNQCPDECDGESDDDDDDAAPVFPDTPPALGTCALYVTSCVGEHGGDGTECCIVAAA